MDGGWSELVNSHLDSLEGRMRLNRLRKLGPQAGEKRTKKVKVASEPGF